MINQIPLKILFITGWYPHRNDPMLGLFVKRHAEAVSLYVNVFVLYVIADENCKKITESDFSLENNIHTVRIYYKKFNSGFTFLNSFINGFRYLKGTIQGYKLIKLQNGQPDIIHVNILTRAGLLAIYLKIVKKIPYIITEHWSRYLSINNTYKGLIRNLATRLIVKNASTIITVTDILKNAMIENGLTHPNYIVIPNVVDVNVFTPSETKQNKIKIVSHISCFEDQSKNISGILNVIKRLSEIRQDFVCRMIGDGMDIDMLEKYAEKLGLKNKFVFFEGLKENNELIDLLRQSNFLIMFSNYETFQVPLIEAFACGIPVLTTNAGGIPNIMKDETGIMVSPGNEKELFEKFNFMLDNFQNYNPSKLRDYAVNTFSYQIVGKQFFEIYQKVLSG